MSTQRVLCKFFAHGACLKGEYCEFSHDWKDPSNNACTFYQKGVCSYGSRCRYDHVKVSRQEPYGLPSSDTNPSSNSLPVTDPSVSSLNGELHRSSINIKGASASIQASTLSRKAAWTDNLQGNSSVIDEGIRTAIYVSPADLPICSFAASGNCPHGEKCPHLHGDMCLICGRLCLHPYRPEEREDHMKACQKNNKNLEALKHSQEIECSICLDRVLSKPTAAERKFGLLSECDHPFCISCIRNWRSNSPSAGMDINTALRACPICRKLSYFVIPSVIWYSNQEEKQEILDSYKAKLKCIECKYFDFGNGACPFGTSCFYKHVYRDGRLEEVVLRHLDAEDGSTMIAKDIRLSDFLSELRL